MTHLFIVPACDEESNIRALLTGLQKAMRPQDACFVFNNASRDGTLTLAQAFSSSDPRFFVVTSTERLPSHASWRRAADYALSQIPLATTVQFVAGDDSFNDGATVLDCVRVHQLGVDIAVPTFVRHHGGRDMEVIYHFEPVHRRIYPALMGWRREAAHLVYSSFSRLAFLEMLTNRVSLFREAADNDWWVAWWILSQRQFTVGSASLTYLKNQKTRRNWHSYHGFRTLDHGAFLALLAAMKPSFLAARIGFSLSTWLNVATSMVIGAVSITSRALLPKPLQPKG